MEFGALDSNGKAEAQANYIRSVHVLRRALIELRLPLPPLYIGDLQVTYDKACANSGNINFSKSTKLLYCLSQNIQGICIKDARHMSEVKNCRALSPAGVPCEVMERIVRARFSALRQNSILCHV